MKKLTAFLLVAAVPLSAMAGGYSIPEQGAKASAMAGAFTGLANDPSAIYFNPAGISFQNGMNLQVGSTFVSPKSQYYNQAYSNKVFEQKPLFFVVPQVFFTMEWEMGLTFGAGIYAPYGLGTEWPAGWDGDYHARKTELQNVHFGGVVAYRVMENLSVAGSFAWSHASAVLEKKGDLTGLAGDVGLEGTGSGIHWGLSALYKPIDIVSIGMNYRAGTELEMTGDIKFSGDRVQSVTDAKEGKGKVTLPLPANFNIGIAVQALKDLMVTADVNFNQWSAYEKLEIINTDKNETLSSSPRNWNDTRTYRLGIEYNGLQIMDRSLALRTGYLQDENPVDPRYSEPSLPDNARWGYTFGAGYEIMDNLSLDVYLLLLSWETKVVTDNEFGFNGVYRTYATLSGLSLSYTF